MRTQQLYEVILAMLCVSILVFSCIEEPEVQPTFNGIYFKPAPPAEGLIHKSPRSKRISPAAPAYLLPFVTVPATSEGWVIEIDRWRTEYQREPEEPCYGQYIYTRACAFRQTEI